MAFALAIEILLAQIAVPAFEQDGEKAKFVFFAQSMELRSLVAELRDEKRIGKRRLSTLSPQLSTSSHLQRRDDGVRRLLKFRRVGSVCQEMDVGIFERAERSPSRSLPVHL